MTDYTLLSSLSDVSLICRDSVKLYYSRWLLGKSCIALVPALEDKTSNEIPIRDYDSNIVIQVLDFIETNSIKTGKETNLDILQLIYEFAHQYDFKKLEKYMEGCLEVQSSIPILLSLHQRKSQSYHKTLQHFMVAEKNFTFHPEIQSVPRFLLDDTVKAYQLLVKSMAKPRTKTVLK